MTTPHSSSNTPFRLPDDTHLGPIRLQVASLDRSLAYYTDVLGFLPLTRNGDVATLGTIGSDRPLLSLHEFPGAQAHPRRGRLGLFHFAILLPTRGDLARFVIHLDHLGIPAGASDHLVSEAIYLSDPDGLGIEVYADRPRSSWRRVGGDLAMATEPLDFNSLVADACDTRWHGMPAGTVIGHMHLHVGDLREAEQFFANGLGFDVVVRGYPGALFLSAGGYHHHLGTNTWAGPRAAAPGPADARLLEWTVVVPSAADVQSVGRHLQSAGAAVEFVGDAVTTRDPWGTGFRIVAEPR